MAEARLEAEIVEALVLDLVRLRGRSGGQCAESPAVLAATVALVISPPGSEGRERGVGNVPLVDERHRIPADPHAVVEARGAEAVGVVVHRVRTALERDPARLAVGFIVGGEIEVGAERPGGVQREGAAPGVQKEIAVRLAEAVRLLVVVVARISEPPERPAERGETGKHPEAAEKIRRLEFKRRVERGLLHHEIDRARRLRSIHERRPAPHKLDALHRVERRRVVGLRVSIHVGVDRNSILEHLHEHHPVRIETPVADAHQRRTFLGQNQPRRLRDRLPEIVHADLGKVLQIDVRGFFPGVDFCALHIGQKRTPHLAVVVRAHLDLLELLHRVLRRRSGHKTHRRHHRDRAGRPSTVRLVFHERGRRFNETESHMQSKYENASHFYCGNHASP